MINEICMWYFLTKLWDFLFITTFPNFLFLTTFILGLWYVTIPTSVGLCFSWSNSDLFKKSPKWAFLPTLAFHTMLYLKCYGPYSGKKTTKPGKWKMFFTQILGAHSDKATCNQFWKTNLEIILIKTNFYSKKGIFQNFQNFQTFVFTITQSYSLWQL